MKKKSCNIFCFLFLFTTIAFAQVVGINKRPFPKDTDNVYSFLVSGHMHGDGSSNAGFPAATLLANLDSINNSNFNFFVSLGDLFKDLENDLPNYKKYFFNKLNIPLFNVVGNHDVSNGLYENLYGKTYYSFAKQSELFIFLDAEESNSSIKGGQLVFLTALLDSATFNNKIKNIFIFSHRPIWAEEDALLKNVFKFNTRSGSGNNYQKEILPLLNKIPKTKSIFWCSGSMDTSPASFFYYKVPNTNLVLMQTAIRNQKKDATLVITVNSGNIEMSPFSFTGDTLNKISSYDLSYYEGSGAIHVQEAFNVRLIPLYIKQMISSQYFWYGIIVSASVIFVLSFYSRRRKR